MNGLMKRARLQFHGVVWALLISILFSCKECPDSPDERAPQDIPESLITKAFLQSPGDTVKLIKNNSDTLYFIAGLFHKYYDRSARSHEECPRVEPLQQLEQPFSNKKTSDVILLQAHVQPSYLSNSSEFEVKVNGELYGPIFLTIAGYCDKINVSKDLVVRGKTYCVNELIGSTGVLYYSNMHGIVKIINGNAVFERPSQ